MLFHKTTQENKPPIQAKKGGKQYQAIRQRALLFIEAILQKIVIKHFRYFHQLTQINAVAFEHLIDIGLLAKDFSRKPIDRATLAQQFLFNQIADVDVFHFKTHRTLVLEI